MGIVIRARDGTTYPNLWLQMPLPDDASSVSRRVEMIRTQGQPPQRGCGRGPTAGAATPLPGRRRGTGRRRRASTSTTTTRRATVTTRGMDRRAPCARAPWECGDPRRFTSIQVASFAAHLLRSCRYRTPTSVPHDVNTSAVAHRQRRARRGHQSVMRCRDSRDGGKVKQDWLARLEATRPAVLLAAKRTTAHAPWIPRAGLRRYRAALSTSCWMDS